MTTFEKAREELVAQGLLRGRRRNGQMIYEITEKGLDLLNKDIPQCEPAERVEELRVNLMEQEMRNLAREGLVVDTGRRRNGQIVWELTEKGKAAVEANLAAGKSPEQPQ